MKKIILFTLLLCLGKAYAQRANSYTTTTNPGSNRVSNNNTNRVSDDNYDQIRIIDSIQEIRADVLPYKNDPKIKNDRYYFWYYNNIIHSTQGGFNGQLLNGHYVSLYKDKNLKEQGDFKRGLKDGVWKSWNQKGDLTNVTTWDEGVVVPDGGQSVWKKIPFLNKKDQQPQSAPPAGNQ
jgi:hypothetical protein